MTQTSWDPRRLTAVAVELPEGVTPPGTRGRILRAALRLFAEYGFHGASIRDIAREVGINSATLYAHYPAKEHVLAELIRLGHEELRRRMVEAAGAAGDDPAEQLAALVRAQVLVHTDYPLLALVANHELHALSPESAAPALALREEARQLLLAVLERGATAGAFDVADVPLTGIAIGSLGMRVANWFGPDQPYTREQVADAFVGFALRLVGSPLPRG
ncbi:MULTISPECIES: TetR/AcrR family transcriptional regulator [Micromonospora]|uniref:TetR/AcrR family transcriptional regulator n=1 Tax=Micromonospora solifontis TaxID=2487138 RepID=A0ABX9WDQ0_9ACTN|nr:MULTISPECIES: TetR/AcrR family transcriptional regulator [Micromonospora]NES16171.1 TetR/AcrR family transcriptional regulator [Micromonospora sp. PPF5-17B]NES38028.1 TetR/AcrR family transcriptional regulator [Micromonospora solifontis]NES57658.1 TetR/AcrR family transcriptional regulator [Micromonospora sp. PPF5-6]RNL97707.1 TetR/AcrR family transcriptional regulator [Micromonospora solifontis]